MEAADYWDPDQPIERRVQDLVGRMSLEEKVAQMGHAAPAIPRLGVPEYDWWSECLHGVARAGIATVFPQAIGLAAAWDTGLMARIAAAISDEGRAKHHEAARNGQREQYQGLTFWSPNVNIFRDPRWGRGQETYGEDPYLTARLGVAFVQGLQGEDPHYLKTVATPKHYAVHSGPENLRHRFDAQISEHDLWDTYLPAFEACVREAGAQSVMGAYNRTNGEACCASPTLLEKILRKEWGFEGYVVSDCGAIRDIYRHHHLVETAAQAAALAVKAGCDLCCGDTYLALLEAVTTGLIEEAELNRAVERLFMARFRLGLFDPPERVPYAQIPIEVNDSAAHRELALEAALKSLVLLKNDGLLPLEARAYAGKTLAVVGPNAAEPWVLWGNYSGTPAQPISILEGIRQRVEPGTRVLYARGCEVLQDVIEPGEFAEAMDAADQADLVIVVLGLSQRIEGEEGQVEGVGKGQVSLGDRENLDLPGVQEDLLKAVHAAGKPVILVLVCGSALAVNWAEERVDAILLAWYPGQAGGAAVAQALFGDFNPAGRLPVTFYRSIEQLPPFEDYSLSGRTYRYFRGEPLYRFGHGLSYTSFAYSHLVLDPDALDNGKSELAVELQVQNTGVRAGDEVVQLYLRKVSDEGAGLEAGLPAWQLKGFQRIHLDSGETRRVEFCLGTAELAQVSQTGKRIVEEGEYLLAAGGRLPGLEETNAPSADILIRRFSIGMNTGRLSRG